MGTKGVGGDGEKQAEPFGDVSSETEDKRLSGTRSRPLDHYYEKKNGERREVRKKQRRWESDRPSEDWACWRNDKKHERKRLHR